MLYDLEPQLPLRLATIRRRLQTSSKGRWRRLRWGLLGAVLWLAAPAVAQEVSTLETATLETAGAETVVPETAVPGDLGIGQQLPSDARQLELYAIDGQAVPLGSFHRPAGLLLVFVANTCPYVLDWLDRLPRLAETGAAQQVAVVAVNANAGKRGSTDRPEAMLALWQLHGLEMPYLVDREAALADVLGARRTPEVLLFDGDWRLVYRGAIDDLSGPFEQVTSHYATQALRQMLSGEEVTLSETQAIGCAIQKPRRRRKSGH